MKITEIFQVETAHAPGNLASVLNVIAEFGLVLEHVSTIRRDQDRTLWEVTVEMDESVHPQLLERLNNLPSVRFVGWSDRLFERHRGGKIEMRSRVSISTQQILRDISIPGAARVCLAIRAEPEKVLDFTYLGRAVAIVTDGSSTAGLGNIGLRAALPALEGNSALLASLVGVSGIPILVESASVEQFVEVVSAIAPSFGAILLTGTRRAALLRDRAETAHTLEPAGAAHRTTRHRRGHPCGAVECNETDGRHTGHTHSWYRGPGIGRLGYPRACSSRTGSNI